MLNSRSKFAMTLAELLMCIGVIGVIAAITLPILRQVIPSKEDSFRKKTNYIVEQVVTQLHEDEILYPKKSDFYSQGFQNTEKVTVNGIEYEGDKKFCELFASKFMISSESGPLVCENEIEESGTTLARGKRSFIAKDGVWWYLPVTSFQKGSAEIMVDINGEELPNCIKDSDGCNDPDRFLYYVKPDGGVTYEKPENAVKNKFKIIVNTSTIGCGKEDDPCTTSGGTYQIATLSNDGTIGAWKSGASSFTNLDSNTRYIIKANPRDGYYVDWTTDPTVKAPTRRVKIYNADLVVNLVFHKKPFYCVVVDIANCADTDVTKCATAKLTSGCGYKKVPNKTGEYKLNDDGAFEYVGIGVDGGEYTYQCGGILDAYGNEIPSNTYTLTEKGHPVRNEDDNTITSDTMYSAVYQCDELTTGDYQLVVTPRSGYKVPPITHEHPDGRYKQDVRLGTEDLYFSVSLQR